MEIGVKTSSTAIVTLSLHYDNKNMNRKPLGFDERLSHSIELLKKSEKLALRYDTKDGFFLAFSGGKDSQALYHVAQMAGVKFVAHMNFTSVDPPQVIRFVRKSYPDVVTHAPEKSIYQLAVDRGILPSMRIRWCCADLKESAGAGKVTLIGIRKQESARRAKRHEVEVSNRRFSGSYEDFLLWQEIKIQENEEKLLRKVKREGKNVNEDYFSADKENEVRCINGKDSILVSPIFEWSEQDVWYFLNEVVKVPHCELYDQGYKRIGCILCPMSSHKQKVKEMQDFPHVKRGWIRAIKSIRNGGVFLEGYIWWNIRADWSYKPTDNRRLKHWKLPPPHTNGTERRTQGFGLDSAPRQQTLDGFSESPCACGVVQGQKKEPTEDEIAENIFDWWVSGKSYTKWYADKLLQQKIEFDY